MQRDFIAEYRELHEDPLFCKGGSLPPHVNDISELIKETGARTVLDYGCGKAAFHRGKKYHREWGTSLVLYDPAVPQYSKRPEGKFDGVICTDVLEHVEDPDGVISDILGYATKFVFLSISCKPAGKTFKDGTNLHLNVHPPQWWRDRVKTDLRLEMRFDVLG